jgi:hypothetical protein
VKEPLKYVSHLEQIQWVSYNADVKVPASKYTFLYGKGNENHELSTRFSVCAYMTFFWIKLMTWKEASTTNSDIYSIYSLNSVKIFLPDANAKWDMEDIFKPRIGNESLCNTWTHPDAKNLIQLSYFHRTRNSSIIYVHYCRGADWLLISEYEYDVWEVGSSNIFFYLVVEKLATARLSCALYLLSTVLHKQ